MRLSLLIISIGCFLVACAAPPRVAVEERRTITVKEQTEQIGGSVVRIIEPGDTLHSIAFSLGLDVNELAAWNQLTDTSKLQVGQRIRLTQPVGYKARSTNQISARSSNRSIKSDPIVANSQTSPQTRNIENRTVSNSSSTTTYQHNQNLWAWPTKGKVIRQFSTSRGVQGIDIQGQFAQPVIASRSGEVVYVGNGLKGYGNLIIIKHNEQFLSAYAHNNEYFVQEGQTVKINQTIASLGRNSQSQTALHFQIRKNGKPVNPSAYLPK